MAFTAHVKIFALLAFICAPVFAQALTIESVDVIPSNDFVIQPAKVELYADPGSTVMRSVTIINRIQGRSTFTISLEDFVGSDDPTIAVQLLGNEISAYTFRDAIQPEVATLDLDFGEKAVVPITITIPETAAPGGYYTSVIVAHAGAGGLNGTGAKTVSRVAQLFFVRVNGDALEDGSVKDFVLTPSRFVHTRGPLGFNILFENRGTVHLSPYGYITVKNIFGTIVNRIPVDAYYTLPQSSRYREIIWNPENRFGYYTATLELNRGYQQSEVVDTETLTFVFMPLKTIIIILVVLMVLFFLRRYIVNNFELKRKR